MMNTSADNTDVSFSLVGNGLSNDAPRITYLAKEPKFYGFMSLKGEVLHCDPNGQGMLAREIVKEKYNDFFNSVADEFLMSCPIGLHQEEYFLMKIFGFSKIAPPDQNGNIMWCASYYDMTEEHRELLGSYIVEPEPECTDISECEYIEDFHSDEEDTPLLYYPSPKEIPSAPRITAATTWEEAYQRILDSPFGYWPKIKIPFHRDEMTAERGLAGSCYDDVYNKLDKAGFVKSRTHLKKNDHYVLVDFWIRSYDDLNDGDGYGGGTTDEYAVGIIDNQGRWAYPLTHCIDSHLTSFGELCSADYLPEDKRPYVWTGCDTFNIID